MDELFRTGELEPDESLPVIPGGDIAGVVDKVGSAVEAFNPGDEVYGTTNRHNLGAYAEYTLATPETVVEKPESLDFAHAAAIPTVGLTARQAVYDIADVSAADRILVHGGAGGVGSFAVQFAANRDATVIATAAPEDHDFVESLGAERVIDYTSSFEDQIYTFETDCSERPASEAIVRAIAAIEGVESTALGFSLYEAVDPDALDTLFTTRRRTSDFGYSLRGKSLRTEGRHVTSP